MTIPTTLHLFSPAYADPINPSSQVDRMPGTADAACFCARSLGPGPCGWPFCDWKPTESEDE